jgi:arsenate reductase (thioredoxin)
VKEATAMKAAIALFALSFALPLTVPVHASELTATDKRIVLFVCLQGAANSQMAAAHFNRMALERDLPYTAVWRGIEPGTSIPTRIRDGLSLDGLEPVNDVPKPLTPEEAATAIKVVAFDTVPDDKRGAAEVNYWSDVPMPTRDYAVARDAIVHHIDNLLPTLAQQTNPQETLRGVITAVDLQNGLIKMRIDPAAEGSFKVQDGVILNAVQGGDHVEITVETIGGTKTIVGLKKL